MTMERKPRPPLERARGLVVGAGAYARGRNIQAVKEMILQGKSEDEIIRYLQCWFKLETIGEYVRIAKMMISESGVEPHG